MVARGQDCPLPCACSARVGTKAGGDRSGAYPRALPTPVIAMADAGDGRLRGGPLRGGGQHPRPHRRRGQGPPRAHRAFGGHAMAAGLTLPTAGLAAFEAAFAAVAAAELGDRPPVRELVSDGELAPDALTLNTAESLRTAGPWGKGFPEPLFDGHFEVLDRRLVGERHLRLRLRPSRRRRWDHRGHRLRSGGCHGSGQRSGPPGLPPGCQRIPRVA